MSNIEFLIPPPLRKTRLWQSGVQLESLAYRVHDPAQRQPQSADVKALFDKARWPARWLHARHVLKVLVSECGRRSQAEVKDTASLNKLTNVLNILEQTAGIKGKRRFRLLKDLTSERSAISDMALVKLTIPSLNDDYVKLIKTGSAFEANAGLGRPDLTGHPGANDATDADQLATRLTALTQLASSLPPDASTKNKVAALKRKIKPLIKRAEALGK